MMLPVLYSYRRCPYAMRARMALREARIDVQIREISFRNKPSHMLSISPKGTVPVLITLDGKIIDESLDVMHWALAQSASHPRLQAGNKSQSENSTEYVLTKRLIAENDGVFKKALDAYKYHERNPEKRQQTHRVAGEIFLKELEALLQQNQYLLGSQLSLADIAIFPFIRQFAAVDRPWFEASEYNHLNVWLNGLIESELFKSVMQKQPTYEE